MIRQRLTSLIIAAACLMPSLAAHAGPERLVADLSNDQVAITSSYHGTELLLFGAFEGQDNDDVVLVVSGPPTKVAQRRSDKVAGIWVNVETNIWQNSPGFYHIFSTRPLTEIASPDVLAEAQLGPAALSLEYVSQAKDENSGNGHGGGNAGNTTGPAKAATPAMINDLGRNMTDIGLWAERSDGVSIQRNTLFRATLQLPKNVPPGDYEVRVVHFRDGQVISQQTTDMTVARKGFSAMVYDFAHKYSMLYGIFAVVFAVFSGWLAAFAFRRK